MSGKENIIKIWVSKCPFFNYGGEQLSVEFHMSKAVDTINLHTLLQTKIPGFNNTDYKWWCRHSRYKLLCKVCRSLLLQAMGARFTVFLASQPFGPAGSLALLLRKGGDVETKPRPTPPHTRVWICDICYKQIHVRRQIPTRSKGLNAGCTS